jgi:hypothetical protein
MHPVRLLGYEIKVCRFHSWWVDGAEMQAWPVSNMQVTLADTVGSAQETHKADLVPGPKAIRVNVCIELDLVVCKG